MQLRSLEQLWGDGDGCARVVAITFDPDMTCSSAEVVRLQASADVRNLPGAAWSRTRETRWDVPVVVVIQGVELEAL